MKSYFLGHPIVLGCIGEYLKGSGAENVLIESSVFGPNVTDSVLSGKNYVRSLKGLQMLKEAFSRLQWAEFLARDDMCKYRRQLKIILELKDKVVHKSSTASVTLLKQFQDTGAKLIEAFDNFVQTNRRHSETFLYWDIFIHLMHNLENLIRSDREGNWQLQLQAIQDLLPIFAACDSTNYLLCCTLYLEDMEKIA